MIVPPRSPMRAIIGLPAADLGDALRQLNEPAYRADQILAWIYQRGAANWGAMTDLSLSLRARLAADFTIAPLRPVSAQQTDGGQTRKMLFALPEIPEGAGTTGRAPRLAHLSTVEAVSMIYPHRHTVCISSQVGCAMGCVFCATGQVGFVRDLTAGEIVAQVLAFAGGGEREQRRQPPNRVVLMGQGEPMANYDAVWSAIQILTDRRYYGLGARHITVSTVGIVPGIKRLAREPLPVNLAVSLHATDDALRSSLVPSNRRYPIADILGACRSYVQQTRRRVSFEYTAIAGVNDSLAEMRALASLLRGILAHVNLIPVNPSLDGRWRPPPGIHIQAMATALNDFGVPATVRDTRGRQIAAACGQLRARAVAGATP